MYVAVVLALTHQIAWAPPSPRPRSPGRTGGRCGRVALGAVLAGRVVLPLWRNLRHQFRVARGRTRVRQRRVDLRHRAAPGPAAGAGRPVLPVAIPGRDRWWQANPFSLSAAPDGRSLRLTAKAVGTASARCATSGSAPGSSPRARTAPSPAAPHPGGNPAHGRRRRGHPDPGAAGGARRTHRRVLPGRPGPDAVLAGELRELAHARGAELHLVTGPPGPTGRPRRELARLVPDITERDIYVCGPPPMMTAVAAQPAGAGRAGAPGAQRAVRPGRLSRTGKTS